MAVVDLLLAAMLAVSAGLQYNDPDPVYWLLVYGVGAVIPLSNALGKRPMFLAAVGVGMTISGLIYAAPGFVVYLQSGDYDSIIGSMAGPAAYVEPAREFLGLLIQLVIITWYVKRWRAV